ncbi:hypothetical protein LCM10_08190 [Rossellomorea aquimaris]|uniref:hypothetical protein n=1 Tax=Rossellomorea aquimaris TaxID=189382 RepID=UPI001CD38172|nr:hypothetical protein [Rossellomorea aquimaris]MCA1054961.1 hypothetical protein [Rossellomorea aquimaris]
MRILFLECKKALLSPVVLLLGLLFLSWNVFLIINSSDVKEELRVVNGIAGTYGTEITDDSLQGLNKEISMDLDRLNAVAQEKSGLTYERAGDLFADLSYGRQHSYTEEELQSFYTLHLKDMYASRAGSLDEAYARFDVEMLGEKQIAGYRLTGDAAGMLRSGFKAFSDRFAELKENGEYKEWFFEGQQYAMHGLLFKKVFRHIVIEALILVVLSTALIATFEFENGTGLVTFTTRRGRKLMIDKLAASLITSSIVTAVILAATLGAYFTVFDYAHLWHSSINSGFNWETQFPYVAWWDFSFLTYLILGIIVTYVCMLLFSLFTFSLSVMLKNSYFAMIAFSVIFIALLIVQGFMPGSSVFKILAGFTLSTLVLNPHQWWMATSGITMFKYYEIHTLIAWAVFFILCCYGSMKKFKKQDIL